MASGWWLASSPIMSFCSSEKARYLAGPERAFDLVFRDLNSNHATCLENYIANKITWLLRGLTSQLFPTGKRTVADIAQLPVPNNATPFEIFQLKISDEALYEENGEVGSSPGRIFLSSAQSIIKALKLNNLK